MARSRNIKPGFSKNEYLALCSFPARLTFATLPMLADKRGRLEDRPLRIKGELFPYDSLDMDALLQELHDSPGDFITRYEVDGSRFIQITNFERHQNPHHREPESAIPPCISEKPRTSLGKASDQPEASLGISRPSRADSLNLIPDSPTPQTETLTPHTETAKPEVVSVCDEVDVFANEGAEYLSRLQIPNFQNTAWVRGFLTQEIPTIKNQRPELSLADLARLWQDACDLALTKEARSPQWLKTTFERKVAAWHPTSRCHGQSTALPDRQTQYAKDGNGFLTWCREFDPSEDPNVPLDQLSEDCMTRRLLASGMLIDYRPNMERLHEPDLQFYMREMIRREPSYQASFQPALDAIEKAAE